LAQAWSATMSAPAPLGFMRVMRVQSPGLTQGAHMIMLPTVGGVAPPGRGLDSYRAVPIGLAFQPPLRRGG
jgi:hypothetical protein